ncbi:MAG TPA: roadblock/LC7 domain-containing protein, partial [Verrucomicrobiae bacterium]
AANVNETLPTPLTVLAETWPDAVRTEIVQLNLVDARVGLPVNLIEAALKRGRVAFPWKTLRSWIRPATLPTVSANDNVELELPLNVLAPLFVARQKATGKSQRPQIDEQIPNLFFGLPQPEPVAAPAATKKQVDTNYYVWDDTSDNAKVDDTDYKRKGPGGTDFIAKYATPNEIVARAASLDGVAGAIIALPDGLSVANRIPPELNGDTLAAFLPHIFSKVSQATKELRMGELNNLNFTVGNVPWKIFRVNAIFFAAFGRAGEQMPTAELAALACEMDRRR